LARLRLIPEQSSLLLRRMALQVLQRAWGLPETSEPDLPTKALLWALFAEVS
jgi:hypothetical protein